jgi:hypothetical protein
MKNIKIMKALTVFSASLVFQMFSAADAQAQTFVLDSAGAFPRCSALTAGQYPNKIGSDPERECKATPTSLIFKVYELSVCTAPIDPAKYNSSDKAALCQTLFASTAGQDIDFSAGSSLTLKPGLSITENTYEHGLLKVGVNASLKVQHEFLQSMTATNNATPSTGKFCFSNGVDITNQAATNAGEVTCNASAFTTVAAPVNFKVIGEGPKYIEQIGFEMVVGTDTSITSLFVLDSDSTKSADAVSADGPPVVLSGSTDRTFVLADQTLSPKLVITPSTTSLDIQFNVTDSAAIIFDASSPFTDIIGATFSGLRFKFKAN